MNTLTPFVYADQPVRVVTIDGEPWFVLADLARVLEITAPARLASRLDEGVRLTHTLETAGGKQQMTIVSEPGMYEVVIRSDKPEAVAFRRWITAEVLPSIRKHGSYGTPQLTGPSSTWAMMPAQGWVGSVSSLTACWACVLRPGWSAKK